MRRSVLLLLVASFTLAACGGWHDSRLNPSNWFGRSRSVPVAAVPADTNALIPKRSAMKSKPAADRHVPVDTISALSVERTNSGAIIHVTGTAARQGAFDAKLRPVTSPEGSAKGVLAYTFDVVYPKRLRPVGSEHSRQITAARSVTNQDLQGIRIIRVDAATNSRQTRRH